MHIGTTIMYNMFVLRVCNEVMRCAGFRKSGCEYRQPRTRNSRSQAARHASSQAHTAHGPAVPAHSGLATCLATTGSCLVAGQLRRRLSGRGPVADKVPLAWASIFLPRAPPRVSHRPPRSVVTASPVAPALRCRLSLHPQTAHCPRDPPDLGRNMGPHHQAHRPACHNPNPNLNPYSNP